MADSGKTLLDADAQYRRLRRDDQAGWGGADYPRRRAGWIESIERLQRKNLVPAPPARVLELGCGNGPVSIEMARRGYVAHGIDLSAEAAAWARERAIEAGLSVVFMQGDVCAMPLDDRSFDLVIDGNCLHCIIGDDRTRCLSEVSRVLRSGGTFVVSTMCGEPRSTEARERFDRPTGVLLERGRPYRTLKPREEIEAEVRQAGLRIMDSRVSVNPWWDHLTLMAVGA